MSSPPAGELPAWVAAHTAAAPNALRERIARYAAGTASEASMPAALAQAGCEALSRVLAHPGDRSVALDLLAADALVTLALLAQAQRDPPGLAGFGAELLRTEREER